MQKKSIGFLISIFVMIFAPAAHSQELVQVGYSKFAADDSLNWVLSEIQLPLPTGTVIKSNVTRVSKAALNISAGDYEAGQYLYLNPNERGLAPVISAEGLAFYENAVRQGLAPDVFVIGGHQVISAGWHNHAETEFMFLPSLLRSVEENTSVRAYFDQVKFAVLGGCNTMTNLEPHKESSAFDHLLPSIAQKKVGDYLSPEEIKAIYHSGEAGKNFVIGKEAKGNRWNSLEYYRHRLATEYGPGNPEHYDYTRGPKNEKCAGPQPYQNCSVSNVDRLFPDSGLWDGSHRYNYPKIMRRLFRNAALVIGWASPSPNDDRRAAIMKLTFDDVRKELNGLRKQEAPAVKNILIPLIHAEQSQAVKEMIITSIRRHWTLRTYELNRQRPAASITPLFPHLDVATIFGAEGPRAPGYFPYRESESGPALLQLN